MKKYVYLFLVFPFLSLAQISKSVPIRGNYLFMSQTEVSNEEYRFFLSHLSSEEKRINTPDSSKWIKFNESFESMTTYYFRHVAYKNYPVVNITYDQANAYCKWLTDYINEKNFASEVVQVRLPTEKEWEYAAKAGNKAAIYPWGTEQMRVSKGKYQGLFQANFLLKKGDFGKDGAAITAKVNSYWKNPVGLYCMSGNVAELVNEKGIVKGGSWANRAHWLRIDKKQYIYNASPLVGFRYVIEYKKLPVEKKKSKEIKLNKKFFNQYFSQINDTLFIGKQEVTNYLFSLFEKETNQESSFVKSDLWHGLFPYSQVWANNYYTHPDFQQHPVVNVDYQYAVSFCRWIEKKYKQVFHESVQIRLPTEKEWELAAKGKRNNGFYPWEGNYLRNKKGEFLANFNPKMSEDENVFGYDTLSLTHYFGHYFNDLHDFDKAPVLAKVSSYYKNSFGIYDLAGNASEMILDKPYTKGGSWISKSPFLQINSKEKWDFKANPYTGFRLILVRNKN